MSNRHFFSKMFNLMVSPFRVLREHISLDYLRHVQRNRYFPQEIHIDQLIIRSSNREEPIIGLHLNPNTPNIPGPSFIRELSFQPRYHDLDVIELSEHYCIINTEGCTISLTPLMEIKRPVTFVPYFFKADAHTMKNAALREGSHRGLRKIKVEIFEYESLLTLYSLHRNQGEYIHVNGFAQGGEIPPPCYWQRCRPSDIEKRLKSDGQD